MRLFDFKSLTKVDIAARRLPLTARRREWRKGWVGVGAGGAWVNKNFALALARVKKERKKEKKYSQLFLRRTF